MIFSKEVRMGECELDYYSNQIHLKLDTDITSVSQIYISPSFIGYSDGYSDINRPQKFHYDTLSNKLTIMSNLLISNYDKYSIITIKYHSVMIERDLKIKEIIN